MLSRVVVHSHLGCVNGAGTSELAEEQAALGEVDRVIHLIDGAVREEEAAWPGVANSHPS